MNATLPTVPTLPAWSVARCSSVCGPAADTATGVVYVVQAPPSSRYSSLSRPDPPLLSLPVTVTVTGPVHVPPGPASPGPARPPTSARSCPARPR